MSIVSNRRASIVLIAVGALVAALVVVQQADAQSLYACVKKNGSARIFSKKPRCKKGETKLSWNIKGIPGKNGSNGSNGINGTNGKEGAAGNEGAAGKNGAVGGFFAVGGEAVFTNLASTQGSVTVISKNLPAGSFIVTGKVNVTAIQTGTNAEGKSASQTYVDVSCTLTDTPTKGGAVTDTSYWSGFTNIPVGFFDLGNATLSFELPVTTITSSTAQISCTNLGNNGKNGGGSSFTEDASLGAITAIQTTQNS